MNFGKHTVYTQETHKIITSNSLSLNIIRAKQPDISVKDIKTHDSKSQGQHSTRNKNYCILRGQIKGFNSAIYAIKCQQVVIELWLGSYRTVIG